MDSQKDIQETLKKVVPSLLNQLVFRIIWCIWTRVVIPLILLKWIYNKIFMSKKHVCCKCNNDDKAQ